MSETTWIHTAHRGVGHTRAAVEGAKATGALLICATNDRAQRLKHEYGIAAVGLDSAPLRVMGSMEAWLFDLDAVQRIESKHADEVARLRAELKKVSDAHNSSMGAAQDEIDTLRAEVDALKAVLEGRAAGDHTTVDMLRAELARLQSEKSAAVEAAAPFIRFIESFDRKPIRNMANEFYSIHDGSEFEASLRLSDLRALAAALSGGAA